MAQATHVDHAGLRDRRDARRPGRRAPRPEGRAVLDATRRTSRSGGSTGSGDTTVVASMNTASCTARSAPSPRRRRRRRHHHPRRRRQGPISTPPAARRCPASATATRTCSPPCARRWTASNTPTPASSPPRRPRRWPTISSHTRRRHRPRLSRLRRLGGHGSGAEARPAVFRRDAASRSARHFIARRQSYHGNTLGALAVGGNLRAARAVRAAAVRDATTSSPAMPTAIARHDETDEAYGPRAARRSSDEARSSSARRRSSPSSPRPVVGATAGAVPPAPGYFRRSAKSATATASSSSSTR